ncbi:hypothetical protein EBT31_21720, partial [bacterium]|nr:hypothetical protein [bacterium]
ALALFACLHVDSTPEILTIEGKKLPAKKTTEVTGPSISATGSMASAFLSLGIAFNNIDLTLQKEETVYKYDINGEVVREDTSFYADRVCAIGSQNLTLAFSASDYVAITYGLIPTGTRTVVRAKAGNYTKVSTSDYKLWGFTQEGQQAIATANEGLKNSAEVAAFINNTIGLITHDASNVEITDAGVSGVAAPSTAEANNAYYADGGDPDNGYRTANSAEVELALGSATAQRRIEFSLPYAPDDTFVKVAGPPVSYSSTASDAAEKATRFGRVQNRLLHGNRNGVNLQLAPGKVGAAPFTPFVLQANGLSALYRTNGTNWQLSADGILMSVDALFWGAVGGTGTFWFPVAPGITSLPSEPTIVGGQMTVATVVPVWNGW